jgi:hypothetical protein
MQSKTSELYSLVKKNVRIEQLQKSFQPVDYCDPRLSKYSRQLGTELEACIIKIIFDLNQDKTYYNGTLRLTSFPYLVTKTPFNLRVFLTRNKANKKVQATQDFIQNYELTPQNAYGINDSQIRSAFIDEIKKVLTKIDYQKFISSQLFIPRLYLFQELTEKTIGSGIIDMIFDNKITDIKSDRKINPIPKDYFSQLLFYYFWLQTANNINFSNKEYTELSRLKIDTIALFYARYDQLFEFKISDLVNNESEIQECFNNEIEYGNSRLRNIIDLSISKKKIIDMKEIKNEIKNERFLILYNHILKLLIKRDFQNSKKTIQTMTDEGFSEDLSFLEGLISFMENNFLWAKIHFNKDWDRSLQTLKSIQEEYKKLHATLEIKINESLKQAHPNNFKNFGESLKEYSDLSLFLASLETLELFIEYNQSSIIHETISNNRKPN